MEETGHQDRPPHRGRSPGRRSLHSALAHYLDPKLLVYNTALMTAPTGLTLKEARADHQFWGRLVESAVGAHLVNAAAAGVCDLFYWRERNHEVDFVTRAGRTVTAIEVKSGRARDTQRGRAAFAGVHSPARKILVGGDGIQVEEFLSRPVEHWIKP